MHNKQETQLSLTNSATRLEVSQGHQTYRVVQNKWDPWLIFSITLVNVHQF